MITTTTDHIEGYRITEYLGVVRASSNGDLNCNDPDFWKARDMARNADAIIGIQYVARDRSDHLIGTAVKIEKI